MKKENILFPIIISGWENEDDIEVLINLAMAELLHYNKFRGESKQVGMVNGNRIKYTISHNDEAIVLILTDKFDMNESPIKYDKKPDIAVKNYTEGEEINAMLNIAVEIINSEEKPDGVSYMLGVINDANHMGYIVGYNYIEGFIGLDMLKTVENATDEKLAEVQNELAKG